ncbi:MAG: hypothetical protein ABI878_02760 [Acidobacteriota bacterium]
MRSKTDASGPALSKEEIEREASVPDLDQIERQGNDKDAAGSVDFKDTPHGREETKKKREEGR